MKRIIVICFLLICFGLLPACAFGWMNSTGPNGTQLKNDSAGASCFYCSAADSLSTVSDSSVVIPIHRTGIGYLQFMARLNYADTSTSYIVLHGNRYASIDSTSYDVRLDSTHTTGKETAGAVTWWAPTATTNMYVPYVWLEFKRKSGNVGGGIATPGAPGYRVWYWIRVPD